MPPDLVPFLFFFFSSIALILKYIITPLLRYRAGANPISRTAAVVAIIAVAIITIIKIIIIRIKILKQLVILDKGVSTDLARSRTIADPYIVAWRTMHIAIRAISNALRGS